MVTQLPSHLIWGAEGIAWQRRCLRAKRPNCVNLDLQRVSASRNWWFCYSGFSCANWKNRTRCRLKFFRFLEYRKLVLCLSWVPLSLFVFNKSRVLRLWKVGMWMKKNRLENSDVYEMAGMFWWRQMMRRKSKRKTHQRKKSGFTGKLWCKQGKSWERAEGCWVRQWALASHLSSHLPHWTKMMWH